MTQPSAPPQLSPDGKWWWDGTAWIPAPQQPADFYAPVPVQSMGYAPTAPVARHDGLAITSLVLSVLWLMGFGSVAAIVTGHLSRSKAKREGREPSGVALAGLILGYVGAAFLVVGILAAIAIPVFLSQRDKGVAAEVKTSLRSAATAEETYYTDHERYTTEIADLAAVGYSPAAGVELGILRADASGYCLGATKLTRTYFYDSGTGRLSTRSC